MATIIGPTLPDPYYSTIESIRDDLVTEFGVDPYPNPFPHFTLYPLEDDVDTSAIVTAVQEAVELHDSFSVHTDGIGVFPGNVVWLPVAKSPALTALQSDVVGGVEDLGPAPMPYYEPNRWFPHVGFAIGLEDELTRDIVGFLLEYDLEWDFTVDSIEITQRPTEETDFEVAASIDL